MTNPDSSSPGQTTPHPDRAKLAGELKPAAWAPYHPDFEFAGTVFATEQEAVSWLMRSGVAGKHGWSVIPLYTSPPAPALDARTVDSVITYVEDLEWHGTIDHAISFEIAKRLRAIRADRGK